MSSEPLVGRAEPRLWTRPARDLTPETSLGFECAAFARRVLKMELFPWQEWFLIHALELNEDGGYRFNTVMLIVARQNGKTELLKLLALWKLFLDGNKLVLGAAQTLEQSAESWNMCGETILDIPDLRREVSPKVSEWWRKGNNAPRIRLLNGARYMIVSTNRRAGRGKSTDTLLLDELREQRDMEGWAALSNTCAARPNHQKFLFSIAGDLESVVYNHLRSVGLAGIEGEEVDGEDPIGLFEWSVPDEADPEDESWWPYANPSLNIKVGGVYTITTRGMKASFRDQPIALFKTENLCMSVDAIDAAIDGGGWAAGTDRKGGIKVGVRGVAFCIDAAQPDAQHVTLTAAVRTPQGRVWVEVVAEWKGKTAVRDAERDLPGYISRNRPRSLGWFPSGPGGAFAAFLGKDAKPIAGVEVRPLSGQDVAAVCMSFAEQVKARRVGHPGQAMLDAHVLGARRLPSGDGWRFSRREDGRPVDGAYAAAGAVHLARVVKGMPGRGEFFAV